MTSVLQLQSAGPKRQNKKTDKTKYEIKSIKDNNRRMVWQVTQAGLPTPRSRVFSALCVLEVVQLVCNLLKLQRVVARTRHHKHTVRQVSPVVTHGPSSFPNILLLELLETV